MKTNYLLKALILVLVSTALLGSCKRVYLHPKNTKTGVFYKVSDGKRYNLNINIYDSRGNNIYTNERGYVFDDYYAADLKPDEVADYTISMTEKNDSTRVYARKNVRVMFERVTEVILYPKAPAK